MKNYFQLCFDGEKVLPPWLENLEKVANLLEPGADEGQAHQLVNYYVGDVWRINQYIKSAIDSLLKGINERGEENSIYDHIMSRILPFVEDEEKRPSRHLTDRYFLFSGRTIFNNYFLDPSVNMSIEKGFTDSPVFSSYERVFGATVDDRALLSILNDYFLLSYPLVTPLNQREYSIYAFENAEQKKKLIEYFTIYYEPYNFTNDGRAPPFIYTTDPPEFLLPSLYFRLSTYANLIREMGEDSGIMLDEAKAIAHDYELLKGIMKSGKTLDEFLADSQVFHDGMVYDPYYRYSFLLTASYLDINIQREYRMPEHLDSINSFFPLEYLFDESPENGGAIQFYNSIPVWGSCSSRKP